IPERSERPSVRQLAANMDTINERMDRAIQSAREVTKKYDQNISDFVAKYLHSPAKDSPSIDSPNETKQTIPKVFETVKTHENSLKFQPSAASTQKFHFPTQFHVPQTKPFSTPHI